MHNRFSFFFLLVLLPVSGCQILGLDRDSDVSVAREDVIVLDNWGLLAIDRDPVRISDAVSNRSDLRLTLDYGGGCADHIFQLYGAGDWEYSDPPGAQLYLSHNAQGDACKAGIREERAFNMEPLFSFWRTKFDYRGPVRVTIFEPGENGTAFTLTVEI